jgi:hypothetical protein
MLNKPITRTRRRKIPMKKGDPMTPDRLDGFMAKCVEKPA